jgi:RHS repeat-associated protein
MIGGSGPDADFGFTGHYYHAPSGLHLALYRAYNADLGRWLSRDPIAESGGMNLYVYVSNDPEDKVDVYGQQEFPPPSVPGKAPGGGMCVNWACAGLDKAKLNQIIQNGMDACAKKKCKGSGGCCIISACVSIQSHVSFQGGSGSYTSQSCSDAMKGTFLSGCPSGYSPGFYFVDW